MSDTFCLLDFLSLLIEDKGAKFYPKHSGFIYKKIGKSTKIKEGYEKFVADPNAAIPITSLTWHKDRLNLSILCKIPGTVIFKSDKIIADAYSTFQYRNYTIIKNAALNVIQFPFTCSKETINKFKQYDVKFVIVDGINIIELSSLPLINQMLIDDRLSAQTLADKAMEILKLEAKMKVFNNKIPKVVNNLGITDEMIEKGFRKDGSYCPPVESVHDEHDYYVAKTFKVKIKGASSIPKVETVENKIKNKKRLNFVEEFMKEALEECRSDDEIKIQKLTKQQLKETRRYIGETKFIIFVSGQWFEEFESFDDCIFNNITFEIGEERVKIDSY